VWIAGLAVFELVAHPVIRAAIPDDASWEEAAAFVRARFEPHDRLVAAPSWTDPIVRHHLGDLTSLRTAAPPDRGGTERVWELSIRGAVSRDDPPTMEADFGDVHVRMWELDATKVLHDFVEEIEHASVELLIDREPRPCRWTVARPGPGGLERGPMMPAERFVCDRRRPWLFVGATVLADLELEPRRCIWQHPAGVEPVRTTFSDVLLNERIVVRAGIDYQVARRRNFAPVVLRVWIDDELWGELVHRDGDGWAGLDIDTSERRGQRAVVRFETTTTDPSARLFCYSASIQTAVPP
jgi:hypothetical protein